MALVWFPLIAVMCGFVCRLLCSSVRLALVRLAGGPADVVRVFGWLVDWFDVCLFGVPGLACLVGLLFGGLVCLWVICLAGWLGSEDEWLHG